MSDARRERDRILLWTMKAFVVVALVGAIGGFAQFILSYRMYGEVSALRAEHTQELIDRAQRLKVWDATRSQLMDAMTIRDGELRVIKQRLQQLEWQDRLDRAQAQATRDRASQR